MRTFPNYVWQAMSIQKVLGTGETKKTNSILKQAKNLNRLSLEKGIQMAEKIYEQKVH